MGDGTACAKCDQSQQNAKAAGHRDWRDGVCFDHAGINWSEWLATLPLDEQTRIHEAADKLTTP